MNLRLFSKKLILAGIFLFALSACSGLSGNTQPENTSVDARIEQVEYNLVKYTVLGPVPLGKKYSIEERMSEYQVPGVSVAVIDDFKIDWVKGYGMRIAGGNDPVTSETLFNAGSISKMFTAAAALTLVESGSLNLDEDINNYLVAWQIPENQFTSTEKVTLRRLLSHSGGIQDGFTNRSGTDINALPTYLAPGGEAPTVTIQQMLDGAIGVDVDGPTQVQTIPGSEYTYSNADYAILQLLLEDITGKAYPEFMDETIVKPLRLESSTFDLPLPTELRNRASWEHFADGSVFEKERLHFPFGGLWISASDLAKFGIEIMLTYNGKTDKLLSESMVQQMLSPQINIEGNQLADAYGFAFDLQTDSDQLVAFHTGGTWGSTCIIWLIPERGQGAVVMTNSASGNMIRFEILNSIGKVYDWPD